MEVTSISEHPFTADKTVIEYILQNRGITRNKVKDFLFPSSELEADYRKLDNINEGVELLKHHIDNENDIRIIVDPDLDGYTSSSIMYQFIVNELGYDKRRVSYYIPETKIHGIPVDDTLEHQPHLLIVPDAGSSEFAEHQILAEHGVDTLIIDHHLVEGNRYSEDALVINNQLSYQFTAKALTGAPMVYLFIKAYTEINQLDVSYKHYLDLATIGMIADRALLTDLSAYYYSQVGLKKIHSPLIKHIMAKSNKIEGNSLTPKDVGFIIAPLINAMTREGKPEDIEIVVDALFGQEYTVHNTRLKVDAPVVEEAFRKMNNTKNRQNKKVKEAIDTLKERIEEKGTADNKVLLVNSTGVIEDSGLNGLVAIKLASEYQRPTLVMQYNDYKGILTGSGRNFNNSPLVDFKQLLEDTQMFRYAAGHSSAFGVGIELDEAMELIPELNDRLADIEYDSLSYKVDLSYSKKPEAEDIIEIAKHEFMWGNGLDAPMIHVHSIPLKKSNIKFIGAKATTWKLDLGTSEAIMFNLSEEQKLKLTQHDSEDLLIEIVGECGINSYMGQQRPQVMIKDFDVKSGDAATNPWNHFDTDDLPF